MKKKTCLNNIIHLINKNIFKGVSTINLWIKHMPNLKIIKSILTQCQKVNFKIKYKINKSKVINKTIKKVSSWLCSNHNLWLHFDICESFSITCLFLILTTILIIIYESALIIWMILNMFRTRSLPFLIIASNILVYLSRKYWLLIRIL